MSDYEKIKVIPPGKSHYNTGNPTYLKTFIMISLSTIKRYRGTTKSQDIETSEKFSIRKYLEIQDNVKRQSRPPKRRYRSNIEAFCQNPKVRIEGSYRA
jgi:hypothetical protein